MLRIYHNQTVFGPILIDDIDDGLPNKEVHRLSGDPRSYSRDGYANKPKQRCYVPRTQSLAGFPQIAGYVDLLETNRVTLSAAKGKIAGFKRAGLITVASLSAASVAQPILTSAVKSSSNLTLTGTQFASLAPDVTRVVITGAGAVSLTTAQITAGSGTASGTSIVIPVALIPGVTATTSSVKIVANEKSSAVVAVA